MVDLFKDMDLNHALVEALEKEHITTPTDVQKKVIPEALKNKDLIVRSATGTGKTLAYLLPLFEKIDSSKKEMQSIILVPTHELAVQIQRQIERLSQNSDMKVKSTVIIGNVNIVRQIEKLKEKPHIIVGSSGRIFELIQKKKITAHTVKSIIIDEADRMLNENNIESVIKVI
jgi:superfamily II DNA/RNA helicase